jgi:hypothetical protein
MPHQSISDRQSRAIDLLLSGESLTCIASTIDVSRQTVSGWLNHHAPFIAELNRRRHQHQLAVSSRFEQAVGLALDLVTDALSEGDRHMAVTVLKMAGRQFAEGRTKSEPTSVSGVVLSLAQQKDTEATKSLFLPQSHIVTIETESNSQSDCPDS